MLVESKRITWKVCSSVSILRIKAIFLGSSCVFDFNRIKDYQVSGQDKKIVDPDGGIHLRRLRLERELRSQQTSDNLPKRVTWPSDGWTLSLEQMPPFQHCYLFAHLAGEMEGNSKKVRRGAFKSKREGYALYKDGHVQKVKFNHTTDEHFCFFESRVKASMTRNKLYRTRVSLSKQTAQVKSGACNCKAGANDRCKHIGALSCTKYSILLKAKWMKYHQTLRALKDHNSGTYPALILQRTN